MERPGESRDGSSRDAGSRGAASRGPGSGSKAPSPNPADARDSDDARAFAPERRTLTLGILLGVTLVGFETLAVVTVAPTIAASLAAVERYGWIFSSFLLATLLGAVVAGHTLDRIAPRITLVVALALFGLGLAMAGAASTMDVLVAARAVQGLGGGALVTALYVAVTRAYPDRTRPRVMALMSSAWVLPALLGPTVAGAVATTFGWRAVFLGLLPAVLLVAALTGPAFASLGRGNGAGAFGARLRAALLLVVGALLLLIALEATAWWTLPIVGFGAWVAYRGLRPLLPWGTLSLARGLPAAVGARGTVYPAFVTAETMVSLMLVTHYGHSPAVAGVILALGSLGWTAGAWLQERADAAFGPESRGTRIAIGAAMVTLGLTVQALGLLAPDLVLVLAATGWVCAGLGIGFAHATSSVHVFALAGSADAGRASAALQIVDQFGAAVGTGLAGAIFAAFHARGLGAPVGIGIAMASSAILAGAGIVAGRRSRVLGHAHATQDLPHV